jgi:hypothetical protein
LLELIYFGRHEVVGANNADEGTRAVTDLNPDATVV